LRSKPCIMQLYVWIWDGSARVHRIYQYLCRVPIHNQYQDRSQIFSQLRFFIGTQDLPKLYDGNSIQYLNWGI
jgi:hypothetical protein